MNTKHNGAMSLMIFAVILLVLPVRLDARNRLERKDGNGKVQWYVELFSNDPKYVEVTIDTTSISDKFVVEDVFLDVEVRSSNGSTVRQRFTFTDDKVESLTRGTHRRWFRHSCPTPKQASGIALYYSIDPKGPRPQYPNQYSEKNTNPTLKDRRNGVNNY